MTKPVRYKFYLDEDPNIRRIHVGLAEEIGFNESVILLQLDFLINMTNNNKVYEGRYWTYDSVANLQREYFPFWGTTTIKKALSNLQKKNLIIKANYNKAGFDKTSWYTINYEEAAKLKNCLIGYKDEQGCVHPLVKNCPTNGQNLSNDESKSDQPIPETSPETSSETSTTGTANPEKKSGRHQTGSQTGTGSQVVDVGQRKEELKNLKEKFSLTDQAVSRHKKQYNAGDTKKFNRFSVRSGHSNDGPALRAAIELYDEGGIDNQFMLDFIEHEWQLWDFSRTNDTDSVKGMLVLECLYVAPTVTHFSLLTEEQKQKELKKRQKKPQGWTQEELEAKLGRELGWLETSNFMNEDGSFDGEGILRREGLTT